MSSMNTLLTINSRKDAAHVMVWTKRAGDEEDEILDGEVLAVQIDYCVKNGCEGSLKFCLDAGTANVKFENK